MVPETNPIFEAFLGEHPEHAGRVEVLRTSDGTDQTCAPLETAEAFARWCLRRGHGDAPKIVRFLAEFRSRVEEALRGRAEPGGEFPPDPGPE